MRGFIVVAMAFIGLAASPTASAAQDSGLRCKLTPGSLMVSGEVQCTVLADQIAIRKVTFNRGNCPARFDDARAYADYIDFWGDTLEHRKWWQDNVSYRGSYAFGNNISIEASGSCGNVSILEYSIETDRGSWTWTVGR